MREGRAVGSWLRTLGSALVVAALLGGCGNWSDEDVEFQAAVPSREELSLTPPGGSAEQDLQAGGALGVRDDALLQQSEVFSHVVKTALDVNRFVALVTAGLDLVRTREPSEREAGRRVWGPYADRNHPGFQVKIEMVRVADGFDYALQWQRSGEEAQVPITGHFAGQRASHGSGRFHYEGSRVRALGWTTEGDATVDLAYDMSGGVARADLSWVAETGASFRVRYRVEPQGAGWMRYGLHANFPQTATAAMEDFEVLAAWGADQAGRADATVTGGDIGGYVGRYGECWSSALAQVWRQRNFSCWPAASPCGEGDASQCARGEITE